MELYPGCCDQEYFQIGDEDLVLRQRGVVHFFFKGCDEILEGSCFRKMERNFGAVVCVVEKNAVTGDLLLVFVDAEKVRVELDPDTF